MAISSKKDDNKEIPSRIKVPHIGPRPRSTRPPVTVDAPKKLDKLFKPARKK